MVACGVLMVPSETSGWVTSARCNRRGTSIVRSVEFWLEVLKNQGNGQLKAKKCFTVS
ncbi:MAG: hypothetical protein M2R45_02121 [Verrucomicrobia subdivision 3 bacterium]|nr:hypothetical protein [Limisphaerales bacterium]MCS1413821.1 hypothetical protein [Limisphaerales bacterium]